MGKKRNTVVVLSSDEEEAGDRSLRSSSRFRTKLSSTVPRETSRRSKKLRASDSGSRSGLCGNSSDWDEIRLFCDDFDEKISGLNVFGKLNHKELWVDKYKPYCLEELAVQKKKVEEVKVWFEERLRFSKEKFGSYVLVISGQAGVGKSATVHAIASHLSSRLYEWNTPTPTVWQEHVHTSMSGLRYTSKLDEFENFVERIRKYGLITSNSSEESKESVMLLIDDLPITNGKIAFGRLRECLYLLVQSIKIPTAIVITSFDESDSQTHTTRYLEELQLSLEKAGACKVAFNPITHSSTKKVLSKICKQEQCNVTAEQVDLIAKTSRGDIRNAITSLQFLCLKPLASTDCHPRFKEIPDEISVPCAGFPLEFGRDETLSLFHALGKFLHNKRETKNATDSVGYEFPMQGQFTRLPLKMDAPERVLCQAHGQARPIVDFLHENVLDFVDDEAIDDAWSVASYLADADLLLASFRGVSVRHNETENVLQSAAASVAARGVLYGNSHPAPPRWHSIRRPKLWEVEKSSLINQRDMVKRRYDAYNGLSSLDFSAMAIEYIPLFKWLGSQASERIETHCNLLGGNRNKDGMIGSTSLDEQENLTSEEEIEDW